ncbi:MAG: hypothetical protein K8F27_00795 [Sulfuricellaceae bacterium]|nr:hypothetical protein [Sulfuricellaceae bacterium]
MDISSVGGSCGATGHPAIQPGLGSTQAAAPANSAGAVSTPLLPSVNDQGQALGQIINVKA